MPSGTGYRIARLTDDEAVAILARNHVGRIAFTFHDRVDIEPVSYAFAGGVINLRTAPGTKLETLQHQPAVAFEVDEVGSANEWRSVVVHGTVYMPDPDGSDVDRKAHAEAMRQLRSADPAALGADDPWAFRSVVLRLHVGQLEGRAAVGG